MATLLDDWTMPEPPVCCGRPMIPLAICDKNGSMPLFHCPRCDIYDFCDSQNIEIQWPFVESEATAADWRAAGFEVMEE